VDRKGQTQASIAVGEVGIDLLDPDSFALDVLGDIMNGFGGRLFDEIRSKEVCVFPATMHLLALLSLLVLSLVLSLSLLLDVKVSF